MIKNKRAHGLSMVEALIWFAVFTAIIVGIMIVYQNTNAKANVTLETKNIQFIFAGLKDAQVDGISNELDNKMASQLGIMPQSLRRTSNGTKITNAWGGDVTLEYIDGQGYKLTYKNVPKDDCVSLINQQKNVGWGKIESSVDDCVTFSNAN